MGLFSKNKKKKQVDDRPEVDDIESWLAGDEGAAAPVTADHDRSDDMVDVGASLAAFAPPPPAPDDAVSPPPPAPFAAGEPPPPSAPMPSDPVQSNTESDLWHFPDLEDDEADLMPLEGHLGGSEPTTEMDNPWPDTLSDHGGIDPTPVHEQRAPVAAYDPETVEIEDATASLEEPFGTPSFEETTLGETSFEPASFEPTAFEPADVGAPVLDDPDPAMPSIDAPLLDAPSFDAASFDAASFDAPSLEPVDSDTPAGDTSQATQDQKGHRDAQTGELIVPDIDDAGVLLEILGLEPGVRWIDVREARDTLIVGHDPALEDDEDRAALARAIRREMNTAYAALRLLYVD